MRSLGDCASRKIASTMRTGAATVKVAVYSSPGRSGRRAITKLVPLALPRAGTTTAGGAGAVVAEAAEEADAVADVVETTPTRAATT